MKVVRLSLQSRLIDRLRLIFRLLHGLHTCCERTDASLALLFNWKSSIQALAYRTRRGGMREAIKFQLIKTARGRAASRGPWSRAMPVSCSPRTYQFVIVASWECFLGYQLRFWSVLSSSWCVLSSSWCDRFSTSHLGNGKAEEPIDSKTGSSNTILDIAFR